MNALKKLADNEHICNSQCVGMTSAKVFVYKDNTATVLCPKCENVKTENVSKYMQISKAVQIKYKCRCGHLFTVFLERREYFRKEVSLPGTYILPEENIRKPMNIVNISCSGLKTELGVKEDLKSGDRMVAEFCLDNKNKVLIRKEVIIRYVQGFHVGAEFYTREPGNPFDRAYDRAIAFYAFQ